MENTEVSTPIETGTDLPEGGEGLSTEEMFEIAAGKNSDGTPKVNKVSKAEALRLAQLGYGSNEKFETAKQMEASMKEFARQLQDPESVFALLEKLGHNPRELISKQYGKFLSEDIKTPEEREWEEMQRDATAHREEKKKREAEEQESKIRESAEIIQTHLMSKIETALEAVGARATKGNIAEVGRYLQRMNNKATQEGHKFDVSTVPLDRIVAHLKKNDSLRITNTFGELDEDGILEMLADKELRAKIGRALTKSVAGHTPQVTQQTNNTPNEKRQPERKFISMKESMGGVGRFGDRSGS